MWICFDSIYFYAEIYLKNNTIRLSYVFQLKDTFIFHSGFGWPFSNNFGMMSIEIISYTTTASYNMIDTVIAFEVLDWDFGSIRVIGHSEHAQINRVVPIMQSFRRFSNALWCLEQSVFVACQPTFLYESKISWQMLHM